MPPNKEQAALFTQPEEWCMTYAVTPMALVAHQKHHPGRQRPGALALFLKLKELVKQI